MSSGIYKIFPGLSKTILDVKEKHFIDKIRYLDHISVDLNRYREMFPNIPETLLRSYYLEFLDHLDLYHQYSVPKFKHLDDIPYDVIIRIFKYLDFPDLIRFAMTNSVLYKYLTSWSFIKKRLEWEREHHYYITNCLARHKYPDLVYHCPDRIEQNYKNQVILKRNLHRINPIDCHEYANYSSYTVFQSYFYRKYFYLFDEQNRRRNAPKVAMQAYETLTPRELMKYEHASAVAQRYGFILCFRSINWTYDKPVPYLDFCHEVCINEMMKDLVLQDNQKRLQLRGKCSEKSQPNVAGRKKKVIKESTSNDNSSSSSDSSSLDENKKPLISLKKKN